MEEIKYKGYLIYPNEFRHLRFPDCDFLFHDMMDCDYIVGTGISIEICKKQIDELLELL